MRLLFTILLVAIAFHVQAQCTISRELKFIEHLVNQKEYEDAIYYINKNFTTDYSSSVLDSLNYLKGWSQYSIKDLQSSASSLLLVSPDSPFFLKSHFFAAYNYSYLGKKENSEFILKQLKTEGQYTNLKNFELAGNALLERDQDKFNNAFEKIGTSSDFSFYTEKEKFKTYYSDIKNHRDKSMVKGVLLSSVIPGSGKIYAGKKGEGIADFIIVAATGATAYENYRKLGFKNAKTILFGSLFAVVYIGNIYGTVFTVKLANEEFNNELDHEILFNMHIPLRNLFN